jgi:peptidoglycan/LPS O-acetylase OafA/YrhL
LRANVEPSWRYLPGLDGLRALAVVAVLLFHADVHWMRGGFLGVDLFFALSGWLITTILLREATAAHTIDLLGFWGRRIRRLMPAALTMIGTVLVWSWVAAKPYERDVVLKDAISAQYYLANWHQIGSSGGYWASFTAPSPFDHLWSLAIEEQFYLVWPLVVWLVVRVARRHVHGAVLAVAAVGSAASFGAMLWLYQGGDPTRVYMGTDTRAFSLLVGAALACAPLWRALYAGVQRLGGAVDVLLAAIVVVLGVMWVRTDGTSSAWLFQGGLLGHSLLSAVLVATVAAATMQRSGRIVGVLAWAPLVAIGRISYGLYLWHWPVYVVLDEERTGLDGPALVVVRLAASFAVAVASYVLVERPIRSRRWFPTPQRGLIASGVAMAMLTVLIVLVPQPVSNVAAVDASSVADAVAAAEAPPATTAPGPSTTTAAPTGTAGLSSATAPPATSDVPSSSTTAAAPPTSAPGSVVVTIDGSQGGVTIITGTGQPVPIDPVLEPDVVWWGDSVAYDAEPGVNAALTAAGLHVTTLAFPGKSMVTTHVYDARDQLPIEFKSAGPYDVVIAQLSEWDLGSSEADQQEAITEFFYDAVSVQASARVILVPGPPTKDLPSTSAERQQLVAAAQQVAFRFPGQVSVLDPTPLWGTTFERDMDGDGIPERKVDGIHICPSGAARYGLWLVKELVSPAAATTVGSDLSWVGGWWEDGRYADPPGTCAAG